MDFIWIQEQVCAPTLQFDDRQKKKREVYMCNIQKSDSQYTWPQYVQGDSVGKLSPSVV